MKLEPNHTAHEWQGKSPHPSKNDDLEITVAPFIVVGWCESVNFQLIDGNRFVMEPKEFSVPSTTRDIISAIGRMTLHCLEGYTETRTVLQPRGGRFADILTEWVPAEDSSVEIDALERLAGMALYFARTIRGNSQMDLQDKAIMQLINELPKNALRFASKEARDFLQAHGFKNISRKIVVLSEIADVSIDLQGTFAARPEPALSDEPTVYSNVRVKSLDYDRSRANLHTPAEGSLTVNIEESRLLDQLHTAGKERGQLMCTVQEVLAAQNKKELKLLELKLVPTQS